MLKELGTVANRSRPDRSVAGPEQIEFSFILVWGPSTGDLASAVERCVNAIQHLDSNSELIVVMQNSEAGTTPLTHRPLAAANFPVRLVKYHVGCGESKGLRVGIESARGRQLIVLPPSASSAPSDVQLVVETLREGFDYVVSLGPRPIGYLHRIRSRIYNALCGRISGARFGGAPTGLCGMRREVLEQLPLYGDLHLFMPMLAVRQGFAIGEIVVAEADGTRSHPAPPLRLYVRRMLDLLTLYFLTRFTEKPFRLFGSIGAVLGATGAVTGLVLVVQRFMGVPLSDRPMLVLAVLLVVIGVQVMSLGLLGELMIYLHCGAERLGRLKVGREERTERKGGRKRRSNPGEVSVSG